MSGFLMSTDELERRLGEDGLVIVDLGKAETYAQAHIPSAVFCNYADILRHAKPVMGLVPEEQQFAEVLSKLGIKPSDLVVAYDDEGGGKAGRFLWTLELTGHKQYALLDGGLHAWYGQGRPLSNEATANPDPSDYPVNWCNDDCLANRDFILYHLNNNDVVIVDARSPEEYTGSKVFAQQGGHIPGAVNYEWTQAMDKDLHMTMRDAEKVMQELALLGITPDKEIVVHCQTHHRSSYTWIMLRHLGFTKVRGYPGSWSDWGNIAGIPVER
ncbi:MAG: sulfurtransferase [Gammaproteobacteria bacterium]|nr:sulfurtransferase [Gammaproteobacteria bacterium]MDH5730357.1 sulfurtransferase [Gammaproteobacteria bacterium]